MPTVEIFDKQTDERGFTCLAFDLIHILEAIESQSQHLDWYFIEFDPGSFLPDAESNPENPAPWVIELWHEIEKYPDVMLSWQRLKNFARNIRQTDIALIVAVKVGAKLPPWPFDPNDPCFEIVVQMSDFTLGAVTTRNESIIQLVQSRFKDTKIEPATRLYY
jgi:hypothetical protein